MGEGEGGGGRGRGEGGGVRELYSRTWNLNLDTLISGVVKHAKKNMAFGAAVISVLFIEAS